MTGFKGYFCAVLSRSVVSDFLQPQGWQPGRLLCPWGFSRQKYWSGLMCPPPGDIPNLEFEPRSPALHADSLLYGEAQEYWSGQPVHSSGELSQPRD